ncbi:MAG: alpha/beta fold hydrolase [Bacteroidota bacterium]|nr:alpha/beta fold hydrolase [Bacteroidota bacterium]
MRKFFGLLFPLFCSVLLFGQAAGNFTGIWEGKLNVGVELRIVFHIQQNASGGLHATADSPDQSAYGLKCDTTFVTAEGLTIEMHNLNASFSGKLINDSTIEGIFTQGAGLSLNLKKVEKPSERKRPQNPQPPFPYKSENIEFDNADKSLHFGATITIPPGKGPFPAAVMITGSGPQNRDEEIMGHKPFAVLADALTKKGMVVLRVDDRGVGKSTGKFSEATSADFAEDVNTSLNYLLSRPEVNKKKVGMIGHSEGGMIAPMVASQRKDINFIILLAGPGIKIADLMTEQNIAILGSVGVSRAAQDAYRPLYKEVMSVILNAPDTTTALRDATSALKKWLAGTNDTLAKQLGFATEKDQQRLTAMLVKEFSNKWFKYFLAFDPAPYLQKLNCKVLAINGSRDIQVISSSNLAGIRAALKKSPSKSYQVIELPGLNHLFQTCVKCTTQEYGELEETFSPAALQTITEWFEKNVK